jgi:hypothetical protein
METSNINLTQDEMVAVCKSLSIGVDQLAKKLINMRGSRSQLRSVNAELALIMSARAKIESEMVKLIKEIGNDPRGIL